MDKSKFEQTLEKFLALRQFYKQYETPESAVALQAVKEVILDLNHEGISGTFFVNGSLSYGIYTPNDPNERSDIDLSFFGEVSKFFGSASGYGSRSAVEAYIRNKVAPELRANVIPHLIRTIEIAGVQEELATTDFLYFNLQELYTCAKLELQLDSFADKYIAEIEQKRKKVPELDEMLSSDSPLFACSHFQSFQKYNKRLKTRGIEIPDEINRLIAEID